ncbi:MAG: hypothetical protein P1V18_05980 [Candidatus Gracilibacteria bacterium]|nr:hypothetical protein [Candidatus Gracilibacteria bacterium]
MDFLGLHRFGEGDLNPGEEIIYRANLYWLAFLRKSLVGLLLMTLGFVIILFAFIYPTGFIEDPSITIGVLIFAGLPFFIGLYQFTKRLIDFVYDEDIITNQRVIDYNQSFFFSREQSTANLKSVENVNLIQNGVLRSLFDFGTLQVQTAASSSFSAPGSRPRFLLLDDIPLPQQVQRLIDEISHRVKSDIQIDKEELLMVCGLMKGDLENYLVVKKSRGWKDRVKKLMRWS